jgi:hypothetical protein
LVARRALVRGCLPDGRPLGLFEPTQGYFFDEGIVLMNRVFAVIALCGAAIVVCAAPARSEVVNRADSGPSGRLELPTLDRTSFNVKSEANVILGINSPGDNEPVVSLGDAVVTFTSFDSGDSPSLQSTNSGSTPGGAGVTGQVSSSVVGTEVSGSSIGAPEPSSIVLGVLGGLGLLAARLRRRARTV